MDPIQQILAQGQMGTKDGGLQQYYFEGQRAGQQQQQINLSKQRLLLEQRQQDNADAIAPYKVEAERLSNINTGIAIKADTMKLQSLTQQNEVLPEILDLQLKFGEHPEGYQNEVYLNQLRSLTQRAPLAFGPNTQGEKLMITAKAAPQLAFDVNRILKANAMVRAQDPSLYVHSMDEKGAIQLGHDPNGSLNGEFNPQFKTTVDPRTGKEYSVFQGSRNSSTLLPTEPSISDVTDSSGNVHQVFDAGKGPAKLVPQDIAARQQRAFDQQDRQTMLKWALEHDPAQVKYDENGRPYLPQENESKVAAAAGITTGTRAKLEQADVEAQNAFAIGTKLAPLLTDDNVGLRGLVSRASDTVIAQMFPGMKISKATEAAALAVTFQSKIVRAMRSDSNIAEPEREANISALPDLTSWKQSAQSSKIKLASALENMGNASRIGAATRGKPITSYWLKPSEIREQLASGLIDLPTANKLAENSAWRLIDTLRQTSQK